MDKRTLARLRAERRLLDQAIVAIERYQRARQEQEERAATPRLQIVWSADRRTGTGD